MFSSPNHVEKVSAAFGTAVCGEMVFLSTENRRGPAALFQLTKTKDNPHGRFLLVESVAESYRFHSAM